MNEQAAPKNDVMHKVACQIVERRDLIFLIVVILLIFTSQTYAEIPVLLLTFVISMVLNSGTNFLFGTISFVSNSVTSILQLALSLDYAIIFSNHFREEHETLPLNESVI